MFDLSETLIFADVLIAKIQKKIFSTIIEILLLRSAGKVKGIFCSATGAPWSEPGPDEQKYDLPQRCACGPEQYFAKSSCICLGFIV
jgi:hypothetical protein